MSGPLVPSNAQFAQQGSVDWVALSNTSVHFSVAVLSRLSRAGIDAFTLQVGRAICFNFSLEPNGQERTSEAILQLKRYGSYGNLIWFGFGIREVITDLADTEEGLTLVALCAALSTTYDTLFTAKVLRELCVLCKAPQSLTPALRQWKALVELCAGILTSAHFVVLLNGFRRLTSNSSPYAVESRHPPTTPSALAEAILTLARISKHDLVNAVFCGGLDCAWLAAFAEWILSLDVGICEANGSFLYRSRNSVGSLPSVTILLSDVIEGGLLRAKTSIVPNGQSLLQKDPALHGISLMNLQGSWSTILHDVFHRNIDALLADNTGLHFNILLRCISTLQRRDSKGCGVNDEASSVTNSWANHPVNPLLYLHHDGGGPAYLDFAARRLPELCGSLSASPPLPQADIADLGWCALCNIGDACSCASHGGRTEMGAGDGNHVCLRTLAEVIVIYLWILLDADLDDDILPSITGLANLYSWQSRANEAAQPANGPWYKSMMSGDYPALGIDLVFCVLSGVSVLGAPLKWVALPITEYLARVGNGICVYYRAVEDPTLPPESISRVRVVRGNITHSGFCFQDLCGMNSANSADGLQFEHFYGKPKISLVQALIQETDEKRLEMAYLLHYLAKEGRYSTQWLHLPLLFRELQRIARMSLCLNGCKALHESETFLRPSSHPPFLAYLEDGYGVRYDGQVKRNIGKEVVDNAQKFLATLRGIPNTWMIFGNQGLYAIILGHPLLLYAMISRTSRCLFPFTECLGCIISMGLEAGLSHASELFTTDDEGRYKYYMRLLASNQTDAVLTWEIEKLIVPDVPTLERV